MQSCDTQQAYVKATVRNELFVHEHRHLVSFTSDQLLHLLHSDGSWPMCSSTSTAALPCPVQACDRFVPTSLSKCSNQPHVSTIIGSNEFGSLTMKQLHCLTCMMSQCIALVKDYNFISDDSACWQ